MNDIYSEFELMADDDSLKSQAIAQMTESDTTFGLKNFVEIFDRKHFIQQQARTTDDNDEEYDAVDMHVQKHDEFYTEIIAAMREHMGILLDVGGDNIFPYISTIYNVFVVRRYENLVDFLVRYINDNKVMLAGMYPNDTVANMSIRNAKKQFRNKIETIVAIRCREITERILLNDDVMNPENMIDSLCSIAPDDYEYSQIRNLMDTCALQFDITKYLTCQKTILSNPTSLTFVTTSVVQRITEIFISLKNQSIN